ncbi:hypothetical protein ACROYT_G015579 [Oculina patagonica]
MAGKDSEDKLPVDTSSKHVEESPEHHNPEPKGKDKQLKKKEVSLEKKKAASQPSSSKTTTVAKSDFIDSVKTSIKESMVEGFRHISKSMSSDIAQVISNADKSILEPSQVLEFLGFVLNSVTMTVTVSHAKAENIKHVGKDLLTRTQPTIREVAVVIGKLVASCPGVAMGPLFYRQLENEKTAVLKFHHGNFDEVWCCHLLQSQIYSGGLRIFVSKPISQGNPSYTLHTDASLQGWGAVFQGQISGGRWAPDEAHQHINCLELKAAYLGLQSFCKNLYHTHVRIFVDNTTAVSYINNMGGTHSLELKQTRPGTHVHDLVFQAYLKDPRLCIVECLQEYIVRTKPLRGEETQLLISFVKPHKAVSKDTIGRWVKCVLTNAGIDTNQFGAHSTRSASTSAAKRSGLDMTTIMKAAGWSNASTFALF